MLLKIKNFVSKKVYEIQKNFGDKIVHLKKMYKFSSDHFLIGHVVSVPQS